MELYKFEELKNYFKVVAFMICLAQIEKFIRLYYDGSDASLKTPCILFHIPF